MELKVIEMGNQIVVTAVPHEVDAYCTFYKINTNGGHNAFIAINQLFVSRKFRGRGIGRLFVKPKPDTPACPFIL